MRGGRVPLTARFARARSAAFQYTTPSQNMIQRPEYSRTLADHFQLKERGPAPVLESSIQPVVIVNDLSRELAEGKAERRRFMASHAQGGVAPNWTSVFLLNQPVSQHVGLVQRVQFSTDAAPAAAMNENVVKLFIGEWNDWSLTPMQTAMPINNRESLFDPSTGTIASSNFSSLRAQGTNKAAAPTGYLLGDYFAAQTQVTVELEGLVLLPGFVLFIQNAQAAVAKNLIGTFTWDEAPLAR